MENRSPLQKLLSESIDSSRNDLQLHSRRDQLEFAVKHFYDGIDPESLTGQEQAESECIRYGMIQQAKAIEELLKRRYGCDD